MPVPLCVFLCKTARRLELCLGLISREHLWHRKLTHCHIMKLLTKPLCFYQDLFITTHQINQSM